MTASPVLVAAAGGSGSSAVRAATPPTTLAFVTSAAAALLVWLLVAAVPRLGVTTPRRVRRRHVAVVSIVVSATVSTKPARSGSLLVIDEASMPLLPVTASARLLSLPLRAVSLLWCLHGVELVAVVPASSTGIAASARVKSVSALMRRWRVEPGVGHAAVPSLPLLPHHSWEASNGSAAGPIGAWHLLLGRGAVGSISGLPCCRSPA